MASLLAGLPPPRTGAGISAADGGGNCGTRSGSLVSSLLASLPAPQTSVQAVETPFSLQAPAHVADIPLPVGGVVDEEEDDDDEEAQVVVTADEDDDDDMGIGP